MMVCSITALSTIASSAPLAEEDCWSSAIACTDNSQQLSSLIDGNAESVRTIANDRADPNMKGDSITDVVIAAVFTRNLMASPTGTVHILRPKYRVILPAA